MDLRGSVKVLWPGKGGHVCAHASDVPDQYFAQIEEVEVGGMFAHEIEEELQSRGLLRNSA